jgi:hypothetical protein
VPETAWPVLLDHLDDLEVWPEKIVDFPTHEAPPVGSLGDMPGPTSLAEKPELRSEDGQDVKTLRLQDSQDAVQVLEPIRLFLVMKTTVSGFCLALEKAMGFSATSTLGTWRQVSS